MSSICPWVPVSTFPLWSVSWEPDLHGLPPWLPYSPPFSGVCLVGGLAGTGGSKREKRVCFLLALFLPSTKAVALVRWLSLCWFWCLFPCLPSIALQWDHPCAYCLGLLHLLLFLNSAYILAVPSLNLPQITSF